MGEIRSKRCEGVGITCDEKSAVTYTASAAARCAAAHSSRIGSWWLSIWSRILALSESVCTETDAEHGPLSAVT